MIAKSFQAALRVSLMVGLAACSSPQQGTEGQTNQTRVAVAVETAPVQVKDIVEGIYTVGSLAPKFQAEIKSEYTGIVDQVYVTEWQQVKKGDPLAKLDTREADIYLRKAQAAVEVIRAGLAEAEVEGKKASREYERMLKLNEAGLVTQQNLDDARTLKEAVDARIAAIKNQIAATEEEVLHAKTRLGKAVIHAPMNGVVAMRMINVGDLAGEVGSPKIMFRIVDNSVLDLTFAVPSWRLRDLQIGQAIEFWSDAMPGRTFQGVVDFINPVVNEADRTIKVVAQVKNEDGLLKGGLFVKGFIRTALRPGALQIPKTGLVSWDMQSGKALVFVARDAKALLRDITTGYAEGDFIEVTSGLDPADQVVLRGGFQLKDGDPVALIVPPDR